MLKNETLTKKSVEVRSSALSIWLQRFSSLNGESVNNYSCISSYGDLLLSIAQQVCDQDASLSGQKTSPSLLSSSSITISQLDDLKEKEGNGKVQEEKSSSLSLVSVLSLLEKSFNHTFPFINPQAASLASSLSSSSSPSYTSSSSSIIDDNSNVDQTKDVIKDDDPLLNLVLISQVLLACAVQNEQHKQAHIEAILAADEDIQTELMTMIEEVLAEIDPPTNSSSFMENGGDDVTTSVKGNNSSSSSSVSSSSPSMLRTIRPQDSNSILMSPTEERLNSISSLLIRRQSMSVLKANKETPSSSTSSAAAAASTSSVDVNESESARYKRGRRSIMSPMRLQQHTNSSSMIYDKNDDRERVEGEGGSSLTTSLTPAAKLFRASKSFDIDASSIPIDNNGLPQSSQQPKLHPTAVVTTTSTTTAAKENHAESLHFSTSTSLSSTLSALTALQEENHLLRMQLEQEMLRKGGEGQQLQSSSRQARESLVSGDDILGFLSYASSSSSSSSLTASTDNALYEELQSTKEKLNIAEARIAMLSSATVGNDPLSSSSSSSSSTTDSILIKKLKEEIDVLRPATLRAEKAEALVDKLKKRLEILNDVKENLTRSEAHAADLTTRLLAAEKEASKVAPLRASLEDAKEKLCVSEVKCSELSSLLAEAHKARDELQSAFDSNASSLLGLNSNTNISSSPSSIDDINDDKVETTRNTSSSSLSNNNDGVNDDDNGMSVARAMIAASGGLNSLLAFAVPGGSANASTSDKTSSHQQLSAEQSERLARLEDERADMLASKSSAETTRQIAKLENDISDLRRIKAAFEMRLSSALGKISEYERSVKAGEIREAEKDEKISKLEKDVSLAMSSLSETRSRLEISVTSERELSVTLEEERTSRAAEKTLATRRHAALSAELAAAHADHCVAIDAMKRDSDARSHQATSALETLRTELKAVSDDAVLREEALKLSFERSARNELETLKRSHASELFDAKAKYKELEETVANLTAALASLEVQKEKGLAYVSNLQAALRARDIDIQSLREEAENELAVMDGQITASRADAESALSRLTLIESRLVEARREADMFRAKAERQARQVGEHQQYQQYRESTDVGGGVGILSTDEFSLSPHASLESVDSYLKLLSREIETLKKEREKIGSLLEEMIHFVGSRGLSLPRSILAEFEDEEEGGVLKGLFSNNENEREEEDEDEDEEEKEEEEDNVEIHSSLATASSSSIPTAARGRAQRVKIDADIDVDAPLQQTRRRMTRRRERSKIIAMRRGRGEGENNDKDIDDDKDVLSAMESAQVVSQSLLKLAEMRNVIANKEISLASLKRKEAESSFSRISLEMQCQKQEDAVAELEAKLTRASLLHQRLMKALSDADIQVLGTDTSFNIFQNDGGEDGEGVEEYDVELVEEEKKSMRRRKMSDNDDVENRQGLKPRQNKIKSSVSSSVTKEIIDNDEFVPASSVFLSSSSTAVAASSVYAPAPRRKEAE